MGKWFLVGVMVLVTGVFSGCQKKSVQEEASIPVEEAVDAALTESQEIAQSDEMAAVMDQSASYAQTNQDVQGAVGQSVDAAVTMASGLAETVASAIPSAQEIQAALKNAGFYEGAIDGNIGPKTKQAIKDFQFKNNLVVDGKVGSKTWRKLSSYMGQSSATVSSTIGETAQEITEIPAAQ